MSRRTIAVYVKAGKLTTRTLALALRAAGRQIRKAHQAHQTPHGRQTVRKLMAHGANTNSAPVEAPALFDRVARKCGVDYAFYKTNDGKHLLLFREQQKDAVTACFEDYSRLVLKQGRTRRVPVLERLKQARERVRRQPVRERTKERDYEDR